MAPVRRARLCHDEHYVEELRRIAPDKGLIYLDGDTSMSPGTWQALMRGVGGAVEIIVQDKRRPHRIGRKANHRANEKGNGNERIGVNSHDYLSVDKNHRTRTPCCFIS